MCIVLICVYYLCSAVSESSSMEVLDPSEAASEPPAVQFPYFRDVTDTPEAHWLDPAPLAVDRAVIERSMEQLDYFRDAMQSSEKWLADFQDQSAAKVSLYINNIQRCRKNEKKTKKKKMPLFLLFFFF